MKCMVDFRKYAETLQESSEQKVGIHCPKFGSGLAGGNWNFITNLIEDIWTSQKDFVYNYSNQSQTRK